MDTASGPMMQIPANLGHETVPSPLTYHQFPMPRLDMEAVANADKRRPPPKSNPSSAGVKRSISSPNVRSLSASSDSAAMSADKRRNKLGYHRTSVACVHCRRRKIRCLLAADDRESRCSNCIRLKKECNFFPVDQQPPHERRPRTGSKVDSRSTEISTSASSSPIVAINRSESLNDPFTPYQPMPHTSHGFSTMPIGTTAMSTPGQTGRQARPLSAFPRHQMLNPKGAHNMGFDHSDHPQGVGWDLRIFENQQIPAGHVLHEEPSQAYWKTPDTPMTPGFSPYSSAPPGVIGQNGVFAQYAGAQARHEAGWHPGRSMSYGGIDETSHRRQDSHGALYHSGMRRSTVDMPPRAMDMHHRTMDMLPHGVDMLPPSLHSNSTSTTTSMSDMASKAPPNSTTSQPLMQYGLPSGTWNVLPTNSPKHQDFGNWFSSEQHQLTKLPEEDVSHYSDHL